MQRGQIYKHRKSWFLRYWSSEIIDGEPKKVRRATRLAPFGKDYPSRRSVLLLAEKVLAPLNAGHIQPESSLTVLNFIENFYLPHVKKELRPSTYLDYTNVVRYHLKTRLGDIRLRDFRTFHAQRILRSIPNVGHTSLLRIKSFLSGAFKHALREGFLDGHNPVRDASVPGRPVKFQGEVYSMEEISRMLVQVGKVDMQAFAVISVAALAGLRLAELRGLRWSDYDGASLKISRTVWRTKIGETKNLSSQSSVPVLPVLKKILDDHHARTKYNQPDDYIFAGSKRGASLNLDNLARRVIIPAIALTPEQKAFRDSLPPDIRKAVEEQTPELKFKGWHAFRRSLATNLYSCGVLPKIIQAIMRHSDIGTTLAYYTMTADEESRGALQHIEDWIQLYEEPAVGNEMGTT